MIFTLKLQQQSKVLEFKTVVENAGYIINRLHHYISEDQLHCIIRELLDLNRKLIKLQFDTKIIATYGSNPASSLINGIYRFAGCTNYSPARINGFTGHLWRYYLSIVKFDPRKLSRSDIKI